MNAPAFRFQNLRGGVLVTNEWGYHHLLSPGEFRSFLAGGPKKKEALWVELQPKGFIRDHLDFQELAGRCRVRDLVGWPGPNLHVMALTSECDAACGYCSAGSSGKGGKRMSLETARRTVEFIFSTPGPEITIEFQGGEPLLNWPALEFTVLFSKKLAEASGRRLHLSLITNFTAMDEGRLSFLAREGVSLCTSLDGPREVHDANRGAGSHEKVCHWLGRVKKLRESGEFPMDPPNAVCTVTRAALGRGRDIVDEFVRLGLERVQLGPLDFLGRARSSWGEVGYRPAEFVEFYRAALDRILELNASGTRAYEKAALIFLIRILRQEHWRYPNVDVLCRLAYGPDGSIYPSDEARLLAANGDAVFRMGNVADARYADLLGHPAAKLSVASAYFGSRPRCSRCVWAPYCRISPAIHYAAQGDPWGRLPSSDRCAIHLGVFGLIFERLRDAAKRKALESWLEYSSR
ncbi:MAG: radical SAM protein [Elusimicrobiota bacterium]